MADEYADPSGDTEAFRAFARSAEPAPGRPSGKLPLIVGVALGTVVLLTLLSWLMIR